MTNIAAFVIDKCGGPINVAKMVKVDISRVYRWTYPKKRGGTGGVIPTRHQTRLLEAARKEGIDLTPNDFFSDHSRGDVA